MPVYLCSMLPVTLPALNLPPFDVRVREQGQSKQIFDIVRKQFVALTPEEWVRQHVLNYLNTHLGYPFSLMAVEKQVKVNTLSQRADIVIYDKNGSPWMIVECKEPSVQLDNEVFLQSLRYFSTLRVPYIVLSNGLQQYCFHMSGDSPQAMTEFPAFPA